MRKCPKKLSIVVLTLGAFHMVGVLAEPLRFFSRSDVAVAPDFELLANSMQTYTQWLYMDHGYFFFAPNPGPGRLIQYTPSSIPTETRVLPDKKRQSPRLLYHRYLMLAEFYNSRFAPSQISKESSQDPLFLAQWASDLDLYQRLQASIVKGLKHKLGASEFTLRRVERSLPTPYMVLNERVPLDDLRLIEILPESFQEPSVQELPIKKPDEPNAK